MGTKVFAIDIDSGAKLHSDERDIAVSWEKRQLVWHWCVDNDIDAKYNGSLSGRIFGVDLWRVKDEHHRMLFLLKWGTDAVY